MIPRATYRLQFHKGFTFADAAGLADYFAELGISHIYASPILTARKGSMHGYDVIDHSRINPELGGEEGFRAMAAALRARGLGIILDIVPNHMAVGKADNPWWLDVLAQGPQSAHAHSFDIDWDAPGLEGKVLAPFLGKSPAQALADGELNLVRSEAGVAFAYYEHLFPLRPEDQGIEPAACAQAQLQAVLDRQHYVLAHWRDADRRINWRRFFDITDLAAIRVAEPAVFEVAHAKIFQLYGEGLIDGARVDHIDGLADPGGYCRLLRSRMEALRPGAWIVVEKILGEDESLPPDWAVDGTTGYDFLEEVSALLHCADDGALTALWHQASGRSFDFDTEETVAREEVLAGKFAAQLAATAHAFAPLLGAAEREIAQVLAAIVSRLRCYRSYANGKPDTTGAGAFLARAIAQARQALPDQVALLDRIGILFGRRDGDVQVIDALRRFSQLSAPVAAKAVEDTAFYRYGRLISRNDVGCHPGRARLSVADFHRRMTRRAVHWPGAMLATATHDHKRGEDARLRLAALTRYPDAWAEFVAEQLPQGSDLADADLYQLLQTVYAAWPDRPDCGFVTRIQDWCVKFLREGKLRSDWSDPDKDYERRFADTAAALIGNAPAGMNRLIGRTGEWAESASLVQLVLKYTLPGVPDLYQGCEFADLSLVDPDNRRPVDYPARHAALRQENNAKMALLSRLLAARRGNPDLWASGQYQPLPLATPNVLAFHRMLGKDFLLVVARIAPGDAEEETIPLSTPVRNLLTRRDHARGPITISRLLADYPAAVLAAAIAPSP